MAKINQADGNLQRKVRLRMVDRGRPARQVADKIEEPLERRSVELPRAQEHPLGATGRADTDATA